MGERTCIKCRGTGYVLSIINGEIYAKECDCGIVKRSIMDGKLKSAGIPEQFSGLSVEDFQVDVYRLAQSMDVATSAKKIAKSFVDKYESVKGRGKGFYFFSETPGSGKTRLAVSIGNDLIKHYGEYVRFTTGGDLMSTIRSTWEKSGEETKLLSQLSLVPVLILDDIGAENPSGWVQEKMHKILDERMRANRITFFTSNYGIDALPYDSRIRDRIRAMAMPFPFPKESVRSNLSQVENEEFLSELLQTG